MSKQPPRPDDYEEFFIEVYREMCSLSFNRKKYSLNGNAAQKICDELGVVMGEITNVSVSAFQRLFDDGVIRDGGYYDEYNCPVLVLCEDELKILISNSDGMQIHFYGECYSLDKKTVIKICELLGLSASEGTHITSISVAEFMSILSNNGIQIIPGTEDTLPQLVLQSGDQEDVTGDAATGTDAGDAATGTDDDAATGTDDINLCGDCGCEGYISH